MTLRTSGDPSNSSGLRLRPFRLLAAFAGAAVLLLTTFAGGSGAGVADYQGTLYFAGPSSSVAGSWQIVTATPGAQGAAPVAAAGVPNSGGVPTGAYKYVYVTTSGIARTASIASNQVSVTNAPVTVTNVPVGAEVYRARIPSSTNTAQYILVGTASATPYVDTSTATSGTLLPQADNRVALSATGWAPFVPGTSLMSSISNTTVSSSLPSIPSSCTGWIVDASGGLTFPAGLWTVDAQVRPDANGNGAASLTAAIWKVDDSGNTVSGGSVMPPTDGGSFTFNATSQTVSVSYTTSSATTLAANEHLCVQFWRHQTTAYSSGGATSRTIQMLAWDINNRISVHPAPNAFPSATLSSPASGSSSQTIPTLSATYADTEGDAGSLTIRLCSDSACGTQLQSSGAIAANNGETKTWNPTGPLADGTYYWQAQAQDSGGASAWTSSRSFAIDNAAPTTTIDSGPSADSNAPSGTFAFSANESVTGFQCSLDGAAFAGCTSPHPYGPLADGSHTFEVKAVADLAGNAGTTTSFDWTIDTVAPNTSITSSPSSLSNTSSPAFAFSATQSGSSFQCSLDGAAFAACPSPQTYSGVADGAHTFEVRAVDPAGNIDPTPDSHAWTIDATPPDTTIGPSQPLAQTTATGATFDFASSELPATFQCSLDGATFTSCSSPKTYSALADGSHTFQVRAVDTATNADPSPASYTWTIDTTPPVTALGTAKPSPNTSAQNATFDLTANEAATFQCSLDGAAFMSCASPITYTGLADGSHTFEVRGTDSLGNVDTSPASYTWRIDNVAPSAPAPSGPADGAVTNSLPQLHSTFADATAGGDSGTVEFRICSSSAPAGTACTPVVQTVTSGTVASGASATVSPAALPDGTYHWQARSRDAAGNYSAWSATQSFQVDSIPPDVPVLGPPDEGARMSRVRLAATFNKRAFAGTGTIEFRICSDAMCFVTLTGGTSQPVINGGLATWAPPAQLLRDGIYYWQARATDSAGNQSAWSPTRMMIVRRLAVRIKPKRVVCARGSVARVRLVLSNPAKVRNRLLTRRGKLVRRSAVRSMRAGATRVRIALPRALRQGSYRLVFDATAPGEKARAAVTVKVGSRACRAR